MSSSQSKPYWPEEPLKSIPTKEENKELVLKLRQAWKVRDGRSAPLESIVIDLGWKIKFVHFQQEGLEALLIPRPKGGFRITLDPKPVEARDRQFNLKNSLQRTRFLIGHELAHLLFYPTDIKSAKPVFPQSRQTGFAIEQLEDFCDQFSLGLLGRQ